jgi:hypothetical protein
MPRSLSKKLQYHPQATVDFSVKCIAHIYSVLNVENISP